jgi:hypothetical protein
VTEDADNFFESIGLLRPKPVSAQPVDAVVTAVAKDPVIEDYIPLADEEFELVMPYLQSRSGAISSPRYVINVILSVVIFGHGWPSQTQSPLHKWHRFRQQRDPFKKLIEELAGKLTPIRLQQFQRLNTVANEKQIERLSTIDARNAVSNARDQKRFGLSEKPSIGLKKKKGHPCSPGTKAKLRAKALKQHARRREREAAQRKIVS